MSRIVYVGGDWVAEEDAKVSVFDRSFLMADGVYEVCPVLDGRIIEVAGHLGRLERSLAELRMRAPLPVSDIPALMTELRDRNDLNEGLIYLQISRGAADRGFEFPSEARPLLVMFTQVKALRDSPLAARGAKIAAMPDIRWGRRDIKTVQLLAPSLMKTMAVEKGADDAWLVEDGFVTEGTSNNAFIVKDGAIITRQLSTDILHGITRASVLRVARELQMRVEERPFTIAEAQTAEEAFITSASAFATGVVEIDGARLGDGRPGPVTARLRRIYIEEALAAAK